MAGGLRRRQERWAQPINYVSFWIVFLGIVGGVLGLLIWRPGMGDFPLFTSFNPGVGPLWPILFVTVAYGASLHPYHHG